jgi:hypothetical protein
MIATIGRLPSTSEVKAAKMPSEAAWNSARRGTFHRVKAV